MAVIGRDQFDGLDFERGGGLLPVVAQHAHTGEVLMLAYASRDALERTLTDGVMWYHSRSRGALWRKGETSGNTQRVVSLAADCDGDAIVARVLPAGPSCHTGDWSCFSAPPTLAAVDAVIAERAAGADRRDAGSPGSTRPRQSHTQRLLADRNFRLKKLGEEAVELALACAAEDRDAAAEEAADLIYHALVACRGAGVTLQDVLERLEARRGGGLSGADAAAAGAGTAPGG